MRFSGLSLGCERGLLRLRRSYRWGRSGLSPRPARRVTALSGGSLLLLTGLISNAQAQAAAPAATGDLIISEFRFHGKTGSADEYVELRNKQDATLDISGWSIRTRTALGLQTTLIPQGTLIPAFGHFLFTGSGYSLWGYAVNDQSIAGDILDDSGVALFNAAGAVQDAAGFTTSDAALREGAGLPSAPTANGQYAFIRDYVVSQSKDTDDSASDFVFVLADSNPAAPTTLAPMPGTGGPVASQLGAPSPEGLTSPTYFNHMLGAALLDPSVGSGVYPNRSTTSSGGVTTTLRIRRTITNGTGHTLKRLRVRVTLITSLGSALQPGQTRASQAVIRMVSSGDENQANGNPVTLVNGTAVDIYGVSLESPSSVTLGGGLGSNATLDSLLSVPLLPGQSRSFSVLCQVDKGGPYNIALNFEGSDIAPLAVGAPTFSDLTEESVLVHAPILPDGMTSLTLQMKGANESAYQIVESNLGGQALTPVGNLNIGAGYDFRYQAAGPNGTLTGPAARLTMPSSTSSWQAGVPISCGGIRWPSSTNTIQSGHEGHLSSFLATDFDQFNTSVGGQLLSTRLHSDTCSYLWSATWADGTPAGSFKNGINRGQGVVWIAPTTAGTVTLKLLVDDQNAFNQGTREFGSRNDAARGYDDPSQTFSTSISVIP